MAARHPSAPSAPAAAVAGAHWRPLLSGPAADRCRDAIDALAGRLDHADAGELDASLATGSAGRAVCLAALAQADGDATRARQARDALDEAVDVVASRPLGASLFDGFTGVAWAADLVDRLLGDGDADRNDEIDDVVADLLERYPDGGQFELIYGVTGLGLYALSRWPRSSAIDAAANAVAHLVRRAERDDDGVFWRTPPALLLGPRREAYPAGGVDLGMAHGMSAVIPFLAAAHARGIGSDTVPPLLDDAVRWVAAHAVPTPAGRAVPYFVAPGVPPAPARTAWCYGDPGIAAGLLAAADAVQRPDWTDLALEFARGAATRPVARTGVTDAGLCHGAAGLAHQFNRMHQYTGAPDLAEAARRWVELTLDLFATAPARSATEVPPPWAGCGLLEGAAGVVLALLAACTDVEPVWDAMFLMSAPGVRDGVPA